MIEALQALVIVGWFVPVFLFYRSVGRFIGKRGTIVDRIRAAVALVAISSLAFPARWLYVGTPSHGMTTAGVATWGSLYVLTFVCAQLLTWTVWDATRDGR